MTNDLLASGDFAKFQSKDQEWFLDAVASTITDHCGWHVSPILSPTNVKARIGNKGIIMLPTLNIVSVERLSWRDNDIPADCYEVHPEGWIQQIAPIGFGSRNHRNPYVTVDFTHGYDEVPQAIAEVGYELTATVLEKASGVVTDMTRGPTMMKFKEFGVVLSQDQKDRLGPHTLPRVR